MIALVVAATLGVAHPFTPPPADAQSENAEGFKLHMARDYAGARAHFARALALDPDYDAARYNLATSLAAEKSWAPALAELDTLLAHNYPRYAARVLSDPDWAPIRMATREHAALTSKLASARTTYASGVDRMLILVARLRPAVESAVGSELRMFRHQELFAFDAEAGRYRQLTDAAGRVLACVRAPDGSRLAVLTQERAREARSSPFRVMEDARVVELDLRTLEPGRASVLSADTVAVSMTFGARGLRIARQTLARTIEPLVVPSPGELVVARLGFCEYYPPAGPAVQLPVAVPADPAQMAWSPSRKQVLLRRRTTPCAAERHGELHLYEVQKGRLSRVARGLGRFDPIWLDEETFAFEDGLGEKAGIRVWRRGTVKALEIPHGAGLRALPEPALCPKVGGSAPRSDDSHP